MTKMLDKKVAIVTGGSRGIGRAIVLMLAAEGCHVAFSYVSNDAKAKETAAEAKALGVKCKASRVDVKDLEAIKGWVDDVKKEFGGLDILVNNAGIVVDKALMLMSSEDWQAVIDTNLTGAFNVTRACIVTFLKQKKGDIVNISSVSGLIGLARQVNYSASKGGLDAFTKSLAKEVAAYNVRVNGVSPGYTQTDLLETLSEEEKDKISALVPLGRLGRVENVASCVKFLLSDKANYITGQIIPVDGGLAIR